MIVVAAVAFNLMLAAAVLFANRRIERAAEEQVDRRVREHQLELNQQLAQHQARLTSTADHERSRFQRQSQEFGLYAVKRQEAYAELFRLLWEVQGLVLAQRDLLQAFGLGYQQVTRDELIASMHAYALNTRQQTAALSEFDNGRGWEAYEAVSRARMLIAAEHAHNAAAEASNYRIVHELFLSDHANEEALRALGLALTLARSLGRVTDELMDLQPRVELASSEIRTGQTETEAGLQYIQTLYQKGFATKQERDGQYEELCAALDGVRRTFRNDLRRSDFEAAPALITNGGSPE